MSKVVVVDFKTLIENPSMVKRAVVELVCQASEAGMAFVITVLNAEVGALLVETQARLKVLGFPADAVASNPLKPPVTPITFKTMFASKMQIEHEVVFVVDSDEEALTMWRESGVRHSYTGKSEVQS